MDRQEIITAIDAEIARLHHARFLIAQSLVGEGRGHQRPRQLTPAKQAKPNPSVRNRETTARSRHVRQADRTEEAQVVVIRVPAREAPRPRLTRAVAKQTQQRTALTSDVPKGAVAVPRKTRENADGREGNAAPGISVPASTFGIAISRGLASLDA